MANGLEATVNLKSRLLRSVCTTLFVISAANLTLAQSPHNAKVSSRLNQVGRFFGLGYGDGYHASAPRKAPLSADLPPRQIWQPKSSKQVPPHASPHGRHHATAPSWYANQVPQTLPKPAPQLTAPSTIHVAPRSTPQYPPATTWNSSEPSIPPNPRASATLPRTIPDQPSVAAPPKSPAEIAAEEMDRLPEDPPAEIIKTPTADDVPEAVSDPSPQSPPKNSQPPNRLDKTETRPNTPKANLRTSVDSEAEATDKAEPSQDEVDPLRGNLLPDGVDPYRNPQADPLEQLQSSTQHPRAWSFQPASTRTRISSQSVPHPASHQTGVQRRHRIVEPPRWK